LSPAPNSSSKFKFSTSISSLFLSISELQIDPPPPMADSDSATAQSPSPPPAPLAPKKENLTPVSSKIAELNESRVELLTRIQGLKKDLHTWRSKIDTQIKIY
ncbi:unnamed protein product, partial [Linum tenue]